MRVYRINFMKGKRKNKLFLFAMLQFAAFILIVSISMSAYATDKTDTALVNYYNPVGSFIYQPEAGIQASDHAMKAGLLYDLENKKIVWQKEMNTSYPIA